MFILSQYYGWSGTFTVLISDLIYIHVPIKLTCILSQCGVAFNSTVPHKYVPIL